MTRRTTHKRGESGYALLVLLLTMSVLAIAAAVAAPTVAFSIKRDREEELIHRGVEYSRAIRRFAKSTGRYPLTLEDLNGKYGIKYIRKLYKDPMTGKDFKLLHTVDIMAVTSANVPQNGQPVQGDGQTPQGDGDSSGTIANQDQNSGTPSGLQQDGLNTGNTLRGVASQSGSLQTASAAGSANPSANGSDLGIIFGVASTSKQKTIREFEHKNHYDQWLFFYDQNHDTGRLETGPTRLTLPATTLPTQPSAPSPGQPPNGQPANLGQAPAPQQPSPTVPPPPVD